MGQAAVVVPSPYFAAAPLVAAREFGITYSLSSKLEATSGITRTWAGIILPVIRAQIPRRSGSRLDGDTTATGRTDWFVDAEMG